MDKEEVLKELEGFQMLEDIMRKLNLTKQSAINLVSKLKKEGYARVIFGGGKRKRNYHISQKKFRPRSPGMYDILNKYNSAGFQLSVYTDHQVHGKYTVEDAIIDAIQTKSFRKILATLRLFPHIKNWPRLYKLAKEKNCWQKVGALYDVSRLYFRSSRMPLRYECGKFNKKYFIRKYMTKEEKFIPIKKKWKIEIPFRKGDIDKIL